MHLVGMVLKELRVRYQVDNMEEHFLGNQRLPLLHLPPHRINFMGHLTWFLHLLSFLPPINSVFIYSFLIIDLFLFKLILHHLHRLLHLHCVIAIIIRVFIFHLLISFQTQVSHLLHELHLLLIDVRALQV